jgi:hypothetical protein
MYRQNDFPFLFRFLKPEIVFRMFLDRRVRSSAIRRASLLVIMSFSRTASRPFLLLLFFAAFYFHSFATANLLFITAKILTIQTLFFTTNSLLRSFQSKIGSKMSSTFAAAAAATSSNNAVTISSSPLTIIDRKRAALFGLYVADATAMPVHWMYNLYQLQRDYGTIRGYVKPKDHFEGSIMNLSNTGGGGRGSDTGEIIGTVINHGKRSFWGRGLNYHYHMGLEAGENTLEAQLTRLLVRNLITHQSFDPLLFLQDYVQFMTTPGSHNDTCKYLLLFLLLLLYVIHIIIIVINIVMIVIIIIIITY